MKPYEPQGHFAGAGLSKEHAGGVFASVKHIGIGAVIGGGIGATAGIILSGLGASEVCATIGGIAGGIEGLVGGAEAGYKVRGLKGAIIGGAGGAVLGAWGGTVEGAALPVTTLTIAGALAGGAIASGKLPTIMESDAAEYPHHGLAANIKAPSGDKGRG